MVDINWRSNGECSVLAISESDTFCTTDPLTVVRVFGDNGNVITLTWKPSPGYELSFGTSLPKVDQLGGGDWLRQTDIHYINLYIDSDNVMNFDMDAATVSCWGYWENWHFDPYPSLFIHLLTPCFFSL